MQKNLHFQPSDQAQPDNGFRLQPGERLVVTQRGNKTIYEVKGKTDIISILFFICLVLGFLYYLNYSASTSSAEDGSPVHRSQLIDN